MKKAISHLRWLGEVEVGNYIEGLRTSLRLASINNKPTTNAAVIGSARKNTLQIILNTGTSKVTTEVFTEPMFFRSLKYNKYPKAVHTNARANKLRVIDGVKS